jgi:hypothetical protein
VSQSLWAADRRNADPLGPRLGEQWSGDGSAFELPTILCDQLEHTQNNLEHLQEEIERLLADDPKAKGLLAVAEFGSMTVAVLRAELGELDRFARMDPRSGLRRDGLADQTERSPPSSISVSVPGWRR